MSKEDKQAAKPLKVFWCKNDVHDPYVWEDDQYQPVEDVDMATCPLCDMAVPERTWRMLNLAKAWKNQTGPRTPAGKKRSSMNNWKTGEHSKTWSFLAPAMPGKFPICSGCEVREACESKPYKYCPQNIAPMMRIVKAYEEGDLTVLKQIAGANHARIAQIIEMMYQQIFDKGVMVEKTRETIKGDMTITESLGFEANPLLNRIPHYLELMGLTAGQQMMTEQEKRIDENMQGFLQHEDEKSAKLVEIEEKRTRAFLDFKESLRKASLERAGDPALKEYNKMKDVPAEALPSGAEEADFSIED